MANEILSNIINEIICINDVINDNSNINENSMA